MIGKERLKELIEQGATIYSFEEEIDLGYPCEIVNCILTDGTIIERLIVHEDEYHHPTYTLCSLTENIEYTKGEKNMRGFNSPLTSKEQLKDYTKEQLIDMCFEMCENDKIFMDYIFKASPKEFEEMKFFYNLIKNLNWGEKK